MTRVRYIAVVAVVAVIALVACSNPALDPEEPDVPGPARVANTASTTPAPAAAPTAPAQQCTERTELGMLTICGEVHEAPSHGGEDSILVAFYSVENRGTDPVTLELSALDIVDPKGARVPMSGLEWSIDNYAGTTTTTIPGSATVKAVIDGKAKLDTIRYHVEYHHEATFKVGTDQATVRSGALYFRHPNLRP